MGKGAIIDRIHVFLANGTTSDDYEGCLWYNMCSPDLLVTEVPQSTVV